MQLQALATDESGLSSEVTDAATWTVSPGLAGSITTGGVFQAFSGQVGDEKIEVAYQGQTASAMTTVEQGAAILTLYPVMVHMVAGEALQLRAVANFFSPGTSPRVEFLRDEVTWTVSSGAVNMSADRDGRLQMQAGIAQPDTLASNPRIDQHGLLLTESGITQSEILKVTGQFHGLTGTSEVIVDPVDTLPFDLVAVPGGSFTMGDDNSGHANEQPAHTVVLDDFEIGRFEVTNSEYVLFLRRALARGHVFYDSEFFMANVGPYRGFPLLSYDDGVPFISFVEDMVVSRQHKDHPVTKLTWFGAAMFCDYYGLRLPTEAEWERVARADQGLEFGTEDGGLTHDLANFAGVEGVDQFSDVAPVGSFPANPLGVHDLAGNVLEFVFDQYAADFYATSPSANPIGPGPAEVAASLFFTTAARGGSTLSQADDCRAARRHAVASSNPNNPDPAAFFAFSRFGFRVAR